MRLRDVEITAAARGGVAQGRRSDPTVGVDSITDAPTAALFIASGAQIIVGPNLNPEIARLCNRRKVAYLPGAATENEISQVRNWAWHRLLPTGGVEPTEASVTEWIRVGSCAVGMGSKLITSENVKARAFDRVSKKVSQVIGWARAAR